MVLREASRARLGVSLLFMINAIIYASVVPRIPQFKSELYLTNTELGLIVAAAPLGALVAGSVATHVIARLGSARAAVLSSAVMAANLVVIGSANAGWWLAVGLFLAGFCDSVGDVANNMHGLRVQRRYGRSIINGFHGIWSVGAVIGGVLGSAAAGLHMPIFGQMVVVAVVFAAASLACFRLLLPGSDVTDSAVAAEDAPDSGSRVTAATWRTLITIGAVGALAGVVEDAGASWGAVYLSGSLDTGPGLAGVAFIALAVFMTVGRLVGDWFVDRFGERAVARIGSLIAALSMAIALVFPTVWTTILGFGMAGLGTATLIPAAMHAADKLPGIRHGLALTAASLMMRIGFLLSPPIIGMVADLTSLRVGLIVVPVAAIAVFFCSRVLERRPASVDTRAGLAAS